jgi:6-phosphogluconolactonase
MASAAVGGLILEAAGREGAKLIRDARVFSDGKSLTHAVADESLKIIEDAVRDRGRAAVCLSGGRTPRSLNELWAKDYAEEMPWTQIHFFWGDERYVPADDLASNSRMVKESLLRHVPVPEVNIHPMRTNFERPEDAAKSYEEEMRRFFGSAPPVFDIIFLGLGPEGHTASLFPGSPALQERKRWVVNVNVPAEPPTRLTMTYAVLNLGANVFFLVEGVEKQKIIQALRDDPGGESSEYPALRVQPAGRLAWFMDAAAAGQPSPGSPVIK